MAITEFIAAIELSSTRLAGIAGRKNHDRSISVLAYADEDATAFVRKGAVYNIDKTAIALTSVIRSLEDKLKCSINKVYVGIGGRSLRTLAGCVTRSLKEESVISQELVDAIGDENLQATWPDQSILDVAPQEYDIDNTLQADPVGVTGKHIVGRFLNIVARTALKRNVELSFEQAKISIADLLVSPVALARVVLSDGEMRAGCALVDCGAETTTVAVYKGNLLRYLSVIPLGGNNITRDIATLQLEEEEAEQLKLQYADACYEEEDDEAACSLPDGRDIELAKLNAIVGARAEEILANVWHQLQLSGYETQLYAGVVFTGGASNLKNLEEAFRKVQQTVSKIKTVHTPRIAVKGCENCLPQESRCLTLYGLLAAGTENCAKPPKVEENSKPITDNTGQTLLFGNEQNGGTNPDGEPTKPSTEGGKKNKKNRFTDFFNSFLNDESDSMDS